MAQIVPGIDDSIGWAHWRIRGGWPTSLRTAGGYATIVVLAIIFTVRLNPLNAADTLVGWRVGLTAIQAALLLLLAGGRVAMAIKTDVNSGMIESHRLMPVHPLAAVGSYLWGAALQPLTLVAVTFAIGAVITPMTRIPLIEWVWANLVLLTFSIFYWVVVAYAAFLVRGGGSAIVIGMFVSISATHGAILWALPASALLLSPLIGPTVFQPGGRGVASGLELRIAISTVAQLLVAIPLYIGAARKYRRASDTALAIGPALWLLGAYVCTSVYAMRNWGELRTSRVFDDRPDKQFMLLSILVTSMLLSLVAVANAAKRDARTRSKFGLPVSAAATLLVLVGCLAPAERYQADLFGDGRLAGAIVMTAIVVLSFMLSVYYLLRIIYRRVPRGFPLATAWIAATWLIPIAVDYGRWVASDQTSDEPTMTQISGCSPLAALILVWRGLRPSDSAYLGLLVQIAAAVVMFCTFHFIASSSRRRAS